MIRNDSHTATSAPPLLELALAEGDMRALDWLATVRAAARAGLRHLVLTGSSPRRHRAARALWECGTAYGMHVEFTATPPTPAVSHEPRVRIAADGIPRLVIPDGIPLTDLPAALGPALAGIASPPVLQALEAAAAWRPDRPAAI
ncbi:hypothetical protein [Streptomyces sp. HPF1205]|uniref:hypothetical protein n=1 Tax=Streptomyces sp. HPF1205 TaxID=2873262 RepID=UPI001CED4F21|nr:hypothetical protein [Streptomyces sp. HPF1205]